MSENGAIYTVVGPDSSRAVFNDPTDPDFVGYLDSENGVTGLLDTADVRESYDDYVEGDGGVAGPSYLSRRTGTLQGIISPNAGIADVNVKEQKLKRASRALRGDGALYWTPTGRPALRLLVRRQGRLVIDGRLPKKFLLPLASTDAYVQAASESNLPITPGGGAGDAGFSSPISDPFGTVYNVAGQLLVTNAGTADAWPRFRIDGPITNPTVRNGTTGKQWTLTYNLAAGDFLIVDAKARTVLLSGTGNRYSAYAANFAGNVWWPLVPGANDVRLLAAAYSAGAQLTTYWRDTYE